MSTTIGDIARQLSAELSLSAGWLVASQWVADRYVQLATRKFKHMRKFGELVVPATVTLGTVAATRDSAAITGDATASAAWSAACVGRWIRVSVNWYEIIGYTAGAAATLTLKSGYAEDSVTAATYTIAARVVTLDPECRWLDETLVNARRRVVVSRMAWSDFDAQSPDRTLAATTAFMWHEADDRPDAQGRMCKAIELYPYSVTSELYSYCWWPVPPTLGPTAPIPREIDPHVLREGAMCNAMRNKMAELLNTRPLTQELIAAATVWRNDYRAQETRWENIVRRDAYLTDGLADDKTITLQRGSTSGLVDTDIRTAYDQVMATWPK